MRNLCSRSLSGYHRNNSSDPVVTMKVLLCPSWSGCAWAGRGQVFGALIRQPVEFFDREEVGALTSRLGSDCQAIVRCLATNLNVAVRNSMQCIGTPPRSAYRAPAPITGKFCAGDCGCLSGSGIAVHGSGLLHLCGGHTGYDDHHTTCRINQRSDQATAMYPSHATTSLAPF